MVVTNQRMPSKASTIVDGEKEQSSPIYQVEDQMDVPSFTIKVN